MLETKKRLSPVNREPEKSRLKGKLQWQAVSKDTRQEILHDRKYEGEQILPFFNQKILRYSLLFIRKYLTYALLFKAASIGNACQFLS